MFITVTNKNDVEFLANMEQVKFVWPVEGGSSLNTIDGTSIIIKEDVKKVRRLMYDWAMYDEQDREQFRKRHLPT